MADDGWSNRRGESALRRAEALSRRQRAESDQAAVLVRQFAADATAAGITPTRLSARSYDGNARYRAHEVNLVGNQRCLKRVTADR